MWIFIRAFEDIGMCKLIPFNCSKGFWSTGGQKRSIEIAAGGQSREQTQMYRGERRQKKTWFRAWREARRELTEREVFLGSRTPCPYRKG